MTDQSKEIEEIRVMVKEIHQAVYGNGKPEQGLRFRVAWLERHEARLDKIEEKSASNEKRILSLNNMGKGAVILLLALEALRWIVPLLQTP